MTNSDADWAEHPDIEKLRRMTDGQIKDFLFTENTRLRAENAELRLIMEAVLNGSGYPSYILAERARAILTRTAKN
jgi:hypothetical protein